MVNNDPIVYRPASLSADVSGVLAGRSCAIVVDLFVVGLLWALFFALLLVMGVFTFGLTWLLLGSLFPIVAVIYNGLTISGPGRGTWGMRLFGVEMRMASGQPVPFVVAAVHAIFYYLSVTFLTPFILLVGLFRADRRLLHDLLAGVMAVRRQ